MELAGALISVAREICLLAPPACRRLVISTLFEKTRDPFSHRGVMRPVSFRGIAPQGSGWPSTGTPWPANVVGRRTGDSVHRARLPFPPTARCRACFPIEPGDA